MPKLCWRPVVADQPIRSREDLVETGNKPQLLTLYPSMLPRPRSGSTFTGVPSDFHKAWTRCDIPEPRRWKFRRILTRKRRYCSAHRTCAFSILSLDVELPLNVISCIFNLKKTNCRICDHLFLPLTAVFSLVLQSVVAIRSVLFKL